MLSLTTWLARRLLPSLLWVHSSSLFLKKIIQKPILNYLLAYDLFRRVRFFAALPGFFAVSFAVFLGFRAFSGTEAIAFEGVAFAFLVFPEALLLARGRLPFLPC